MALKCVHNVCVLMFQSSLHILGYVESMFEVRSLVGDIPLLPWLGWLCECC